VANTEWREEGEAQDGQSGARLLDSRGRLPECPSNQQAAAILRGVRAVSSSDNSLAEGAALDAGSTDEMLRAARNQSLYREVNERIEELNERFDAALSAGATWVCECADTECSEPMSLTLGEYEELRSHPNRFAVLPGHVLEEVERVVDADDRYVVVEKVGPAAAIAAELDPRQAGGTEAA
jgi:hypothetical protein